MATSNLPVHGLNKYLWSRIEAEGIMKKTDYALPDLPGGIVPIVPIEETPDLIRIIDAQAGIGSKPYIVYTWSKENTGPDWFMKTQQVAYAIRSGDDLKLRQLINLFEDLFQDYELAAYRVNQYVYLNGTNANKEYTFKTISITTLGGQMPAEREAGVNESLITIRITYTGG